MPPEKNQGFDAQIVGVWDTKYIEFGSKDASLLLIQKEGTVTPLSLDPLRKAAHLSSPRALELFYDRNKEYFDAAAQSLTPDQKALILDGRNQMVLTLNTAGGNGLILETIKRALSHIEWRGGHTVSYVSGEAGSAGADILSLSKERNTLACSQMMWHAAIHEGIPSTAEEIQKDTEEYASLLLRHTKEDARTQMLAILQAAAEDPANTYNEVRFTGDELSTFGIVHAHGNTSQMLVDFEKTTGLTVNLAEAKKNPIARFFLLSRLMEETLMHFGVRVSLNTNPEGKVCGSFYVENLETYEQDQIQAAKNFFTPVVKDLNS